MSADILEGFVPEEKIPDGTALQFTVSRTVLDKALSSVVSVVPGKHYLPVLVNVHVEASGNQVKLTGTNGSVSVVQKVEAFVKHEGAAVFPVAKIVSIARDSTGSDIKIRVTVKKGKYFSSVESDNTNWEMVLADPKPFPLIQESEVDFNPVARVSFLSALQRVRKSVSVDSMRPYLMLADISKGRIRSSDASRLQQVKLAFPFDCQIPSSTVHELVQRMTASNLADIEVAQTETSLLYRFGQTLMISQKSTCIFPDMDEVMLKPVLSNDLELSVDRKSLLVAIKRTRINADPDTAAIVLSLNHGSVSVQTKDFKGNTAVETIDATWNYSPRHLSFNHQHLTDLLSSTESDTCVFRLGKDLKTKSTPLLMEDEAEGFTAVLSQINVDWMN